MQEAHRRPWPRQERRYPHACCQATRRGVIFLVGREKNEPGTDFSDVVVEAAKAIASDLNKQPIERLEELTADGKLKEICNAKEK